MKKLFKTLRKPFTCKTARQFFNGKWFETKTYFVLGYEIKEWEEHYQIFPFQDEVYHKMFNEFYLD